MFCTLPSTSSTPYLTPTSNTLYAYRISKVEVIDGDGVAESQNHIQHLTVFGNWNHFQTMILRTRG